MLRGLPADGVHPVHFPAGWGARGREGFVVRFTSTAGAWIGNFQPGAVGIFDARVHPNGRDALVFAGDCWKVDVKARRACVLVPGVTSLWELVGSKTLVLERSGLAFAAIDADGLLWHTRRLSWDGFDEVRIDEHALTGLAHTPIGGGGWLPFCVNLRTGESKGGSYLEFGDDDHWECLALNRR